MATRLSRIEHHDIALGAALWYSRSADSTMHLDADYEWSEFKHHPFDRQYATEIVLTQAAQKIGEQRSDELSGKQIDRLVASALYEFNLLLTIGYCHRQGFTTVRANH